MTVDPSVHSPSPPAVERGGASAAALRTEDLTVRFGGLTALNSVNFEVKPGEIRAIIGPNGAGKSTFFNCLTGVHPADLGAHPPQRRQHHRAAPQPHLAEGHRPLLPDHQHPPQRQHARERAHRRPVAPARLEHADPPRRLTATSSTRRRRCSTSVGLGAKADELAANLSHGEQRNLEIGIALATEPQLLCLDEPTAGMSAAETHDTMQLVRRIAKDLTILIVEHDMQVVMELCHRITVLHYGEVLAEGTPAEIQQNPQGAGGLPQDMSAPATSTLSPQTAALVTVEDVHTYYGKSHILQRRLAAGGQGRGGGPARAQRRRQEHHAQDHHGAGQPQPGPGAVRGQADHRAALPQAGAARHRLRARGPPHLQAAHRDGEPAHRPRPHRRHGRAPAASCWTRRSPTSRGWPSVAARPAARSRAASSRCWPSPGP